MNQIPEEKSVDELRQEQLELLKQNNKVTPRQRELIIDAQSKPELFEHLMFDPLFKYKGVNLSLFSYCSNALRGLKIGGENVVSGRFINSDSQKLKAKEMATIHDEIMNKVFIQVFESLPRFTGINKETGATAQFKTYVYTILKRTAYDYFLKELKGKTDVDSLDDKDTINNLSSEVTIGCIDITENGYEQIKNKIYSVIENNFKDGSKSKIALTAYFNQVFNRILNDEDIPSQTEICRIEGIGNATLSEALKKCRPLFKDAIINFEDIF